MNKYAMKATGIKDYPSLQTIYEQLLCKQAEKMASDP